MALNFPSDTSVPYIDPVSGLKYLWNSSIGAWESAIQPPVIITEDAHEPNVDIDGFLWWNLLSSTDESRLFVRLDGNWVPVSTSDSDAKAIVIFGPNAPANPVPGSLWWDSVSGQLFVWYEDDNSAQWVEASPSNTDPYAIVIVSSDEPPYPKNGTLWYNTDDDKMYIYVGNQWKSLSNNSTFRSKSVSLSSSGGDSNPIGTVITYAGNTVPEGYLVCDGGMINISDYPSLYDIIGNNYSSGSHSTKFKLPDLRGNFVRGWSMGQQNTPDTGRGLGTYQQQEVGSGDAYNVAMMYCIKF